MGAELRISNFGSQGIGLSLAVEGDNDGSKLQMDFSPSLSYLSLAFGNDDPSYSSPTDLAWLEIWNGGSLVTTISMAMNRDDIMNQSISYSGGPFDQAFFWYGDGLGNPETSNGSWTGLIEIVDSIEYRAVPEPTSTLATAALLGVGAFGLRRWRNRA